MCKDHAVLKLGGLSNRVLIVVALVGALALLGMLAQAAGAAEPGAITEYPIPVETTPYAIASGPEGKIWFVDSGNHAQGGPAIGRMSTSGAIGAAEVVPFPHSGLGLALTAGPDGNMWAQQDEYVDKVPAAVSATGQITAYEYPSHAKSGGFGSIAVGPEGRLWIGLNEVLAAESTLGEGTLYETESPADISGVISGPGGRLWFGAGNRIQRIATNGVFSGTDVFPLTEGSGINDMTLGPDGNVWFTLGSPSAVGKITPTGTITLFDTPTASALPFGIAAGPDGQIWFTERNADTVGSIPVTATTGAEIHEYPVKHSNAGLIGIVAGSDNRMWFTEFNENSLGAITTGVAAPTGGSGSTTQGGSTGPGGGAGGGGGTGGGKLAGLPRVPSAAGCVAEQLSLLDVLAGAGKAHLLGVAPRSAVGQQVKILSSWNGKVIGKAKVAADGSFAATVSAPPSRFRHGAKGSYAVKLGKVKSARILYSRRLYTSSITASGGTIVFVGSVVPPLAKPADAVLIRAASSCAGVARGAVVGKATPGRGGVFSVKVALPAALERGSSVYFRAETVVRAKTGKKTLAAVGLVRGIKLVP